MAEWQPIETAPMDGTAFLGLAETQITAHGDCHIWMAEYDGELFRNIWDHWPLYELSHWMPLPEPPNG